MIYPTVTLNFQIELIRSALKASNKDGIAYFNIHSSKNILELELNGPCGSKIRLSLSMPREMNLNINFGINSQDLLHFLEILDEFECKNENREFIIEYNFSEFIVLKSPTESNIECLIYLINANPLQINTNEKIIGSIGGSSTFFRKIFSSCNSLECEHINVAFSKKSISFIKNGKSFGSIEINLCLENSVHSKMLCFEQQNEVVVNIAEAVFYLIQCFLKVYDEFLLELTEFGVRFALKKKSFAKESILSIYVQ
jgi:hypothetical protein